MENASAVPESELFTKFGFVPLELTVAELEPEIIEGGMFYATLPFKKKPSRARSRSSSSDRLVNHVFFSKSFFLQLFLSIYDSSKIKLFELSKDS